MKKEFFSPLMSSITYSKWEIKRVCILFFILINISLASAQTALSDFNIDTTLLVNKRAICGFSPSDLQSPFIRIASAGSPTPAAMAKSTYPASAIFDCGKFRLYYEDIALGSGIGFDAGGGVGAIRRNTLCAVYQYVQTIFDFSNISAADPITIEIQATPAAGAFTYLASAGPVYPGSAGTPGIYNGSVLNHSLPPYTSPVPALFDGTLVVNFETYTSFYDDLAVIIPNCSYDLFSICLHEVGHQLGFLSLLREDAGFNPVSAFGSNQYSLFDWQNIWHGNISTATFEKIVTGTLAAPQINPAIVSPANYLRDESLWLNNNGRFLNNLPLYSGTYWPTYAAPGLINLAAGSVASHMDGEYLSFTKRFSFSPGFRKPHSMQPYFSPGETRREFTEQEIRIFLQLGYSLNPTYATSLSINGTIQNQLIININRPPYTTKAVTSNNAPATADRSYPDMVQTADFPPMVNNGVPLIINLVADATIQDLDGDIVHVEDNTLYNIRGCGNGANNHNQINVDPTGTIITFTPRPNFIGRAQFGFYLHDGKERGSFMIYTIDVNPGPAFVNTPNVNTPAGNPELIVNGDFEEGTESRRKNSGPLDESVLNTNYTVIREEGLYFGGDNFADAHPLQYANWYWTSGSGIITGNAFKECFQAVTPVRFGHPAFSFPHPAFNNPIPVSGNRYSYIFGNHNYNTLSEPMLQCQRYIATFDVNFANTGLAVGSVYVLNLQVNSIINFPSAPFLQTIPINIIVGAGWQTIVVPFTYCSPTPGNFINFDGAGAKVYYDNLSLIEDPSPTPPLNVSITNSLPSYCSGTGSSSTLTASATNVLCSATYSWAPGGGITAAITVSPTITTTYTVTINDGCRSSTASTTITVTPSAVATFSYTGSPFCQSAANPSPTFSGGGVAGTFSSTVGLVFVSTSTGQINLSASTAGTYTVTNTISASGGCPVVTAISSITITAPQIATFSYTGSPYCQSAANPSPTFSGGGVAGTFSSTAGLVFVSTSTGQINLSASTAGTYTVTNTIAASGGCPMVTTTSSITITAPQVATFSYTGSPYCQTDPNPSPAYSGGGIAGTFSSTVGLVFVSTASGQIDLAGSTLGTYIVTNTIPASGGCPAVTATATITINNCTPTPCGTCPLTLDAYAVGGILSVDPTPYRVYCLNSNISISGTVNINLSEVKIAPGVTITVLPGATLNINGSHLYSCTDMWQGIVVQPNGRINVVYYGAILPGVGLTKRSPMIEDAMVAINIQAGSPITTGYILNIINATFNRNEKSIVVGTYGPVLASYPFSIVSSIFTCRAIGFTSGSLNWPLTNTVRTAPPPPSPLQTPYINSSVYAETGVGAYLKPPFTTLLPGVKSNIAIQLSNIGFVVNPATIPTWYEIKIGANGFPKLNVFDNHRICINASNSNFTCVNNVFQNTIGGNNSGGTAINASAKELNFRAQVIAGTPTGLFNNKFYDCSNSIVTTNYFENTFTFCDVRSTQVGPLVTLPPPPPTSPLPILFHRGENGFSVTTNRFRIINMSDNKLYNIENAIVFKANFGAYNIGGVYSASSGQYSGQVNVDRNQIARQVPTFPVSTQFVRSAISLTNVIASGIMVIPGTTVTSSSNIITDVHKGILTSSWSRKNVITNSNTISLVTDPFAVTPTQYGVGHSANSGATFQGNSINANTVTGTSIFSNPNVFGVVTQKCNDEHVACNSVNGTTHGIEFAGFHFNVKFDNNFMANNKYGYVLSSGGIIGTQGDPSHPMDNSWSGTWTPPNYKTATLSSSAQNSKMYIRTSGVSQFNPDPSGIEIGGLLGIDEYLFSATPPTLIVSTSPLPYIGCAVSTGGGGGGSGGSPGAAAIALMESIAQDNISFVSNDAETKYINKNQLYRLLKADPSLRTSSVILQNFYTTSLSTVRETFSSIEDDIASGDLANGQSKTNALAPSNAIEDNYKTFFDAYLKYQTDTILSSDSIAIVNMANGCPFTDGDIVYQARALYNSIFRTNIFFENNCPEVSERSFLNVKDVPTSSSFDVLVYPNPNTGNFALVPFSSDINELYIKVVDVTGKTVYEKTINSSDRMFNLNLDSPNGIYIVHINDPHTNESIVKRIAIQK